MFEKYRARRREARVAQQRKTVQVARDALRESISLEPQTDASSEAYDDTVAKAELEARSHGKTIKRIFDRKLRRAKKEDPDFAKKTEILFGEVTIYKTLNDDQPWKNVYRIEINDPKVVIFHSKNNTGVSFHQDGERLKYARRMRTISDALTLAYEESELPTAKK